MRNQGVVFFSNRLEILFEILKAHLFPADSDPFAERLLVVPSQSIKNWIQLRLAQDLNICAGIDIYYLGEALSTLSGHTFPSQIALMLKIEKEIRLALQESDPIWDPLRKFTQHKPNRIYQLAKHLTAAFLHYGVYGKEASVDWKEMMWRRVSAVWETPLLVLSQSPCFKPVHLFGFNHLAPVHFQFFQQGFFYQLSACKEFWSDKGDLAKAPLLSAWGKVGREMGRMIEESELPTEEFYIPSSGTTQLEQLQNDLLLLGERKSPLEDDTIQIHLSTNPHREIQNLHNTLLGLMEKEAIEPKDILVLAPDISLYEPYIRTIFKMHTITDLPAERSNSLVQGLFLLLELDQKRWSAPALLNLFSHPLFREKRGWSDADLLQIREWVASTGIRWGIDAEQRDRLLKKGHCTREMGEKGATWKEGIGYLLEELARPLDVKRITLTQAELLGEWATTVESLDHDLSQLLGVMTLSEWVFYLKHLILSYFVVAEEQAGIFYKLDLLAREDTGEPLPFSLLSILLKQLLQQEPFTLNGHQLQSIRFSSFLPNRGMPPAKVICLIGMNQEAFPRKEPPFYADLLKSSLFALRRTDFDRFAFLEAILAARSKLILSYVGKNSLDFSEEPPSLVISELFSYVHPNSVFIHPARSYDERYFSGSNRHLKNFSKIDFFLAKRFQSPVETEIVLKEPVILTQEPSKKIIQIKDLVRCLRSPILHYLYHKCGVTPQDETELENEEAFTLSAYRKAILRKGALKYSPEVILERAKREKDFPLGVFGKLAQRQLTDDLLQIPSPIHFQTLEVTSLNVCLSQGQEITLQGKIEGVTDEGLFVIEKSDSKGKLVTWPYFLILNMLHPEKNTLTFRDGEQRHFFGDAQIHLHNLLEYYFLSLETPSFLFPDWIEPILKQESHKLDKILSSNLGYDPGVNWYLRGKKLPSSQDLIQIWHPQVKKLFGELVDAWF